jgi:hypothetical protein
MLAPGFNRWGQVLLHFGTSPFEDSVKAVSGEMQHLRALGQADFASRSAVSGARRRAAKTEFKAAWKALKARTTPEQLAAAYRAVNVRDDG